MDKLRKYSIHFSGLKQGKHNFAFKIDKGFFEDFENLIQLSQSHNGWYTPENVFFSIQSWASALTEKKIKKCQDQN